MKIRTDFVTNSSSVSYILTMCDEMVDSYLNYFGIKEREPEKAKVIKKLREEVHENGTSTYLEGKQIFTKRLSFNTDETLLAEHLDKTFDEYTDEDLWAYILGEYVMEGALCKVWGFGITQVETY